MTWRMSCEAEKKKKPSNLNIYIYIYDCQRSTYNTNNLNQYGKGIGVKPSTDNLKESLLS